MACKLGVLIFCPGYIGQVSVYSSLSRKIPSVQMQLQLSLTIVLVRHSTPVAVCRTHGAAVEVQCVFTLISRVGALHLFFLQLKYGW